MGYGHRTDGLHKDQRRGARPKCRTEDVVEGVDEIERQQGGRVAQGVAFRLRTTAFLSTA
jgi:hypothetical protein